MSSFRYFLVALGVVVGSEVIFRCLKHFYNAFINSEGCRVKYENQLCMVNENRRIFSRVIFFPDQGIISGNLQRVQDINTNDLSMPLKEDYDPLLHCSAVEKLTGYPSSSHVQESIFSSCAQISLMEGTKFDMCIGKEKSSGCDSPECELKRNYFFPLQSIFQKQSSTTNCNGRTGSSPYFQIQTSGSAGTDLFFPHGYLKKSTSLIHMISVLESAKKSLMICVFVLTCKDLIDAILRAKQRGVRVRVLLEKGMANCEATISILLKHRVVFRLSNPALLMHHKFAVLDAPEQSFDYQDDMFKDVNRNNVEFCEMSLKSRSRNNTNDTGSFVQSRFSSLWKRFRISPKNSELHYSTKPRPPQNNSQIQTIFDGVLMTGSFNWTWSAVVNNNENVIITNNPHLITKYVHEFESLWKNAEAKADVCRY